jgi:hypothetical protein
LIGNLRKVVDIPCPDDAGDRSGLLIMDKVLLPYPAPAGTLAVEGANDTGVFIQVPDLEDAATIRWFQNGWAVASAHHVV